MTQQQYRAIVLLTEVEQGFLMHQQYKVILL